MADEEAAADGSIASAALNPLISAQIDYLNKHGITAVMPGLLVSEPGSAHPCTLCNASSGSGMNPTQIVDLPDQPWLCAKCIVKFVRHGVFVVAGTGASNPIPILVDEDGDMHVDDVTITWEN